MLNKIVCATLLAAISTTAFAALPLAPGETPAECGQGGIVREFSGTPATFDVYFTDANGNRFPAPIVAGVAGVAQPAGGFGVNIPVPPTPGACDARNVTHHPIAGGGGGGGAIADLSIESLYLDALGNTHIEGTFARLFDLVGFGELRIPDLYADTNGDGVIGDGDVLYSLVDIRSYTPVPLFTLGEAFTITNGTSALLPGMLFSTTEFTFSPSGGFSGTPFNGTADALTEHDPSVPEPESLAILGAGLAGLCLIRWRKCS